MTFFSHSLKAKIQSLYVRKGIFFIIKYSFIKSISSFISIAYTYKVSLDEVNSKSLSSKFFSSYSFNELNIDDKKKILNNSENKDETFYFRYNSLSDNSHNFVIKKNGEICGFCSLKLNYSNPNSNHLIDLNLNGYFSSDYIFKKHRGKNLQVYSLLKRIEFLKNMGYKTATCFMINSQYVSKNNYEKHGFRKIIIVVYIFRKIIRLVLPLRKRNK